MAARPSSDLDPGVRISAWLASSTPWTAARFYLEAVPRHGQALAHGVALESVQLLGRDSGPYEHLNPAPWIDLSFVDERGRERRCRASGQLGALGGFVSADIELVRAALQQQLPATPTQFSFYQADGPLRCARSRDIGLSHVLIFLPFFALTARFFVATISALREHRRTEETQ